MTLDNLMTMAKTDRYTQDKTYKPGEISEKTGLQKQNDGSWAPPKGGKKNVGSEQKTQKEIEIELGNRAKNDSKKMTDEQIEKRLKQLESNLKAAENGNNEAGKRETLAQIGPLLEEQKRREKSTPEKKSEEIKNNQKIEVPKNAGRGDYIKINGESIKVEYAQEGRYGSELGTLLQYEDPETKKNKFILQTKNGSARDVTKEYLNGTLDSAPLTADTKIRVRK